MVEAQMVTEKSGCYCTYSHKPRHYLTTRLSPTSRVGSLLLFDITQLLKDSKWNGLISGLILGSFYGILL